MFPHKLIPAALAAGTLVVLAACGGGTTTPSAAPRATSSAAAGSASDSTASAGADDSNSSNGNVAAGADDFCTSATGIDPAALAGPQAADPAQLESDLEKAVASAPSEIKADYKTIADVEIPILEGKVSQDEIEQKLSDPKVQSALEHIASFAAAHCNTD